MIYFAKFGDLVKIGYSKSIACRFNAYGGAATFMFAIDGDRGTERRIHELYRGYRCRRETFRFSEEEICELREEARALPGFVDKFPKVHRTGIYIDPIAHGLLREIADEKSAIEERDVTLKELLLEGVNLVLQRYGKKPVA